MNPVGWLRAAGVLVASWCSASTLGADHGVVLLYHHIDEGTPASTSVSPDRFRKHLDYLLDEGFVVMPLVDMLDALTAGDAVPDNAVAITFDDAYQSIATTAAPELVERGMPYTVFIATGAVDEAQANIMSWTQLRGLDRAFADFGAHTVTHGHLVERRQEETELGWRERVTNEIVASAKRIEAALDTEVRTFAYPYGEYDAELVDIVAATGLYGIAQQSGAFGAGGPAQQVPRFAMSTGYDSVERLATAVSSRPMPIATPRIRAVAVRDGAQPVTLDVVLRAGPVRAEAFACFSSGPLAITRTGATLRIALPPLTPGRNKINCTAPSTEAPNEFFWYSHLWIVADAEGRWLSY